MTAPETILSRNSSNFDGLTIGACVVSILCALTDVKIFDVQLIELFVALYLPLFLAMLRFKIVMPPPFGALGRRLIIFAFFTLVGSIASLRLNFFLPGSFGILKTPPYASFVRLAEVFLAISTVYLVGLAASRDRTAFERILNAFILGGVLSAAWSLLSLAGWMVGYELAGAYEYGGVVRARGFFVEGGPFGVYLTGTLAAVLLQYFFLRSVSKRRAITFGSLIFLAIALSQSKASILVAAVMGIAYMYSARRVGLVLAGILAVVPVAVAVDFGDRLNSYIEATEHLQHEIRMRPDDRNYIMGRLAASVILPRMVEKHPVLGIGIGNYSLVRNDPEILQGMPRTREWDLHGLGLLGYVAELGIPVAVYLLFVYGYPLQLTHRFQVRNRGMLAMFGAFPLCATLFGAQVTFAYPWLVVGLALASICLVFNPRARPNAEIDR